MLLPFENPKRTKAVIYQELSKIRLKKYKESFTKAQNV